jgi:hypothetical protein
MVVGGPLVEAHNPLRMIIALARSMLRVSDKATTRLQPSTTNERVAAALLNRRIVYQNEIDILIGGK